MLDDWSSNEHKAAFDAIQELYRQEKEFLTPALKEAQLEERFFRPVLKVLGYIYEVRRKLTRTPIFPIMRYSTPRRI